MACFYSIWAMHQSVKCRHGHQAQPQADASGALVTVTFGRQQFHVFCCITVLVTLPDSFLCQPAGCTGFHRAWKLALPTLQQACCRVWDLSDRVPYSGCMPSNAGYKQKQLSQVLCRPPQLQEDQLLAGPHSHSKHVNPYQCRNRAQICCTTLCQQCKNIPEHHYQQHHHSISSHHLTN